MTDEMAESVADTSWAPATSGFLADDAPFGSVLGDPLTGSLIFDVSVLDDTPGTQPEGDVLHQERTVLSEEERAQVARADRRNAAHRQAQPGPAPSGRVPTTPHPAHPQPVQQAAMYGPARQPVQPPVAIGYGQPVQPQPAQPAAAPYAQRRPASQPARRRTAGAASSNRTDRLSGSIGGWVLFVVALVALRACAD